MRAAVLHEGSDQLVVEQIRHTALMPREVRVAHRLVIRESTAG